MNKLEQTVAKLKKYNKYNNIEVIERVGGLSNENYLVDIDGAKHIIRVPGEAMSELETSTLLSESLNAAKLTEVSNNFVPIKIVNGVKVQPYIEGARTYDNQDVSNEVERISDVILMMHEKSPTLVTHFNLNAVLNKYTTAYFVRLTFPNENLQRCVNLARNIDAYLKKHKAHKVASHNDPLANNWVEGSNRVLHLIDYEYAGQNYYAFDLAAIITECKLDNERANNLISRYAFRSNRNISFERAKFDVDACIFYQEVIWCLWGLVKALDFDGNVIDNEMLDYADARLSTAINRYDYTAELLANY